MKSKYEQNAVIVVAIIGSFLIGASIQNDTHVNKVTQMKSNEKIVWKAIINYVAGYRVEDENGVIIVNDLSSSEVMKFAVDKARSMHKQVIFQYWAETTEGLEKEKPFGPSGS